MKTSILISFPLFTSILLTITVQAVPLTVHPDNPRYFTDGSGKAIYMTGSHNWDVLIDKNNVGQVNIDDMRYFIDEITDNLSPEQKDRIYTN